MGARKSWDDRLAALDCAMIQGDYGERAGGVLEIRRAPPRLGGRAGRAQNRGRDRPATMVK